jgi:hypothetical protein
MCCFPLLDEIIDRRLFAVMPALVAGIHVFGVPEKTWMAGSSPAMTAEEAQA